MANNAIIETKGRPIPIVPIIIGVVVLIGAGVFLYLERESRRPPSPGPMLTGDAKVYVRSLRLLDVEMKAHESYLKQSVVEITGKIGNEGDRALKLVGINCIFYDAYGQVVLRERVSIVGAKTGGLAPAEIKSFRLAFDNIPESWNQAMPQLVIANIEFG